MSNRAVRVAIVFPVMLLFVGCTNPDGALTMKLVPSKSVFKADEPMRLTATFSADKGVVCIDEPSSSTIELQLFDARTGRSLTKPPPTYLMCDNFASAGLIDITCFFDVGDLMDRYAVLSGSATREFTFDVVPTAPGRLFAAAMDDPNRARLEKTPTAFKPGKYRLTAFFRPEPSGGFPKPMFWTVYQHPVEASLGFDVSTDRTRVEFK